jgi:hypothetical protein
MTNAPTGLLQEAADKIAAYMDTLDTRQSVCSCCGVTKYERFHEVQTHKELAAIVKKLRRFTPRTDA